MNPQDPYAPNGGQQPAQQPQQTPPQPHLGNWAAPAQNQPYAPQQPPTAPPEPNPGIMPPAQPANAPSSSQNPYDFIVADNQPRPSGKFSFGGSKAMKLLAIVLGVGVLLVIGGLVLTNLAPQNNAEKLYVTLVQDQQEIVRVAAQGNVATSEETRALAANTQLTVSSDQKTLVSYLSKSGVKVDKKQLGLKRDSTVDTALLTAKATNTYDTALSAALVTELKSYMSDIQTAYKQSSGESAKLMLGEAYAHANLLLKQAGADTTVKP